MRLSKRLEAVAAFVPEGSYVADVGTDHGYIPIYLVSEDKIPSAVAMDVRPGPLERAKTHIEEFHLEDKIAVRLSDGLKELQPEEADTVVIAGMGGELILHILEEGRHVWGGIRRWILSPQSDLYKVRLYLEQNGFVIEEETMVEEEGKYYTVMRVIPGTMAYHQPWYYLYGKKLIDSRHPVLKEFLLRERRQKEAVLSRLLQNDTMQSKDRQKEITRELDWIKEALNEMS